MNIVDTFEDEMNDFWHVQDHAELKAAATVITGFVLSFITLGGSNVLLAAGLGVSAFAGMIGIPAVKTAWKVGRELFSTLTRPKAKPETTPSQQQPNTLSRGENWLGRHHQLLHRTH